MTKQGLIDIIHDHSHVEVAAIGRFVFLLKSDRLSMEEREWVIGAVNQEVEHARLTCELAAQLGPQYYKAEGSIGHAMTQYQAQVHESLPEEMLVYIYQAERLALKVFEGLVRDLREAGMESAARHYEWIVKDERDHVAGVGRILHRLFKNQDIGPRLRALHRKNLRQHYRGRPYRETHAHVPA